MQVDWLIVGAGFTGAVLAERIASQLKQKVLIVEQRDHIGGNAYDYHDEQGVLVHQYGPHIFHTNAKHVWDYLAQFTQWRSYYHHVLGVVDGKSVPIPFNLNSLYSLFPPQYAAKLEQALLSEYGFNVKVPILKIRESAPSEDLKFLADYIYRNVFHSYTLKQWNLTPEELAPSVTARVPIYISRDDRYFQDTYQGLPKNGYTPLFRNMLNHPNIKVLLNTTLSDIEGEIQYKRMIYTGAIDDFFQHIHGELPYRSLHFNFIHTPVEQYQAVGTVNYPNEYHYTRITEFKHLTGQRSFGTSYVEEYPQVYVRGKNIPYYPIPKDEYRLLYKEYEAEAQKLAGKVLFAGRLADYQYYNMDQAIARALSLFDKVICQA
ncbi:UDP-galactopyranose mutase [Beggiatoa leptomitoformis]|uniref:UDP-galactopyranose mutase n=1 Tax=Beggiatoa leptomitoformis TaxID=288004 RepID=A0A2N9YD45_9GAMM|nr:UDP-galactopyranose mutase [Beggiatoa leptomitoformis]ALG69569.1 UDP-galactopyranose mutase [Beggiatoa leptomitoformis]AUI68354.1 UDP-galactopyranose mutase [Beggiatoa leptomitoformis]